MNDNGWTGNAASIDGHPPLDWRQDLSPATRERWTSLAAVEIVLRDALHGVPLQYIVRKIEQEGVWGQIAQAQTFRIIKQQCGAIFTLTRKTIPANEDAVNIAIYEFKHVSWHC